MNHSDPQLRDTLPDGATVERLAKLCEQEITAVRTYEKVLTLPALVKHSSVLLRCWTSHRRRAEALSERVAALDGQVPRPNGIWGTLLPMLALSPDAVGQRLVVSLLENAEDEWLQSYREEVTELDPANRDLLYGRLIPAQESTHALVSDLKRVVQS